MVWQDIALFVLNLIFSYAIIPQVYKGFKDKRKYIVLQTSITTLIATGIQTIVFFTLGLKFASGISLFMTLLWAILLYQSLFYKAPELNKTD